MIDGKKILAVVPARGGSKGIKLKNIQPLNGVPLVAIVGNLIKQLPYIDKAIVSTDHPEIARVALESGLEAPFMRPESISGDIISDWDVLHHALLEAEDKYNTTYDIIVMLQPSSPLRKPEHVTATINKLIQEDLDAVWSVSETDSKAHPLKQLVLKNNRLDYYDEKGAQVISRQQLQPVYHRNGAAYAISRDCLIKQKTIKGIKTSAVVINDLLVNIDTEFDLRLTEIFLNHLK